MNPRPGTPHIVGLGGTTRPNSSSERALRRCMATCEDLGATTRLFVGDDLVTLPHYDPQDEHRTDVAHELVEELRRADGIVVASPAYHGSVSGMLKNALDYVEDMREDSRVYFAERAMGIIVTGYGWQAIVATINTLRTIGHALRAWPTPLGCGINSSQKGIFGSDGDVIDDKAAFQLDTVAAEVIEFANWKLSGDDSPGADAAGRVAAKGEALPA